ncbi:hypothetical protein Goshw_016903 [Gossypium schwendimanii]|uniref:Neprosin PEP catalytic domain-containing protein n=1 Tax=Gossypium schwendimanii TaxID=34291 RepID=A0A7J9L4B0_GOSSC|nr:hypothetical protein [Gossypium schwendimanii]
MEASRLMIMSARQPRNLVLLIMLMQIMFGLLQAVEEWQAVSEEEKLEMERQLKIINKSPVKSFKTDYGDIFDCIDIYKQHAFDHPLLKHHKVQMRPKHIPESMVRGKSPRFLPKHIKCPPGSVLIKRTTQEDLIMDKKIKALGLINYPTSSHFNTTGVGPIDLTIGNAYAAAHYFKHNFGAKTIMNVWNPTTLSDQASFAYLWIANGPADALNVVQAGWGVQPQLFSSNYTRLLTYWTVDGYRKTGCTNYLCPGFVQVHRQISLGMVLNQISIYNGTQSDIEIAIIRDGEWWLKLFNQFIGYWPQKLFYYMYGGANVAVWGGMAASPTNELSPPMGSGHFPKDGHQNKSAYFKQTRIWDNANFVDPEADKLLLSATRPDCYGSETAPDDAAPNAIVFFYGGPGQCNL